MLISVPFILLGCLIFHKNSLKSFPARYVKYSANLFFLDGDGLLHPTLAPLFERNKFKICFGLKFDPDLSETFSKSVYQKVKTLNKVKLSVNILTKWNDHLIPLPQLLFKFTYNNHI